MQLQHLATGFLHELKNRRDRILLNTAGKTVVDPVVPSSGISISMTNFQAIGLRHALGGAVFSSHPARTNYQGIVTLDKGLECRLNDTFFEYITMRKKRCFFAKIRNSNHQYIFLIQAMQMFVNNVVRFIFTGARSDTLNCSMFDEKDTSVHETQK